MTRLLATVMSMLLGLTAAAQATNDYPSRPVTLVVGFAPGTATDTAARLLAEYFSANNTGGHRFIVENRGGQGGSLGAAFVARSAPDGYTITVGASAPQAINPHVYAKVPYDPRRDFTPIGRIVELPYVLVTKAGSAHADLASLTAAAKKAPGAISYASSGIGTTAHLMMAVLGHASGTEFTHVPYRSTTLSITDLLAGRVDVLFDNIAGCLPFILDGKLQPLAVGTATRSSLLPDVPTVSEAGVQGAEGGAWLALFGPPNLPEPIVTKLNAMLGEALKDKKIRDMLLTIGMVPDFSSPGELGSFVHKEYNRWGEIVRMTGARAE